MWLNDTSVCACSSCGRITVIRASEENRSMSRRTCSRSIDSSERLRTARMLLARKVVGGCVRSIASISSAAAFLVSLLLAYSLSIHPQAVNWPVAEWIHIGNLQLDWTFRVDTLSVTMMLVVSGVGTLIHIYAIGYMHEDVRFKNDPGRYRRFFVFFNLFIIAMMILVGGDSYLMLFVGWEGVGLCSFLLIGFWYEMDTLGRPSWANADAAKKAIEVTQENIRLGQRAWVGAIEVRNIAVRAGAKTQFTVVITNTGRTPALKLVTQFATGAFPSDQVFVPKYQTLKTKPGVSVLQPGARLFLNVGSIEELTDTHIDSLKKSAQILYVFGRLTYEDIFKQPHYTIFCMRIAPNLAYAYSCDTHNDAN